MDDEEKRNKELHDMYKEKIESYEQSKPSQSLAGKCHGHRNDCSDHGLRRAI